MAPAGAAEPKQRRLHHACISTRTWSQERSSSRRLRQRDHADRNKKMPHLSTLPQVPSLLHTSTLIGTRLCDKAPSLSPSPAAAGRRALTTFPATRSDGDECSGYSWDSNKSAPSARRIGSAEFPALRRGPDISYPGPARHSFPRASHPKSVRPTSPQTRPNWTDSGPIFPGELDADFASSDPTVPAAPPRARHAWISPRFRTPERAERGPGGTSGEPDFDCSRLLENPGFSRISARA